MHPHIIKTVKVFSVFIFLLSGFNLEAQTDSATIEKLRTESGVDPTRVNSRAGFSMLYYNRAGSAASINNKLNLTIGVNRWSFAIKPEFITQHNGINGTGFKSGLGDLKFSILNAFFVKGKNSLAASFDFSMPFGKQEFSNRAYSVTPALTFAHTINPTLFLAIQPQYTFDIVRDESMPKISVFTNRTFIAKFTSKGAFYVFEPRIIYDLSNKNFDFIISPIIGQSLGAGFNLIFLMEIPTKKSSIDNRGVLYQIGFNKNF